MAVVTITLASFGDAGDSFGLLVDDQTGLISGAVFTVNDGATLCATVTDTSNGRSVTDCESSSTTITTFGPQNRQISTLGLLWTPHAPIHLKDRTDTIALNFTWTPAGN